jgi:hypothetical protein
LSLLGHNEDYNRILLVTITNVKYPVISDVLYTIFFKYGDVQRIICFPRQLGEQALVEMRTIEQAKTCMRELDGTSMYPSASGGATAARVNLLKLQYSSIRASSLEIS